jgi:hypothetical protein
MMGGEYLVNSVEDVVDPLLEGAKMPTLKDNAIVKVVAQGSLVAIGFYCQMRAYGGGNTFSGGLDTSVMRYIYSLMYICMNECLYICLI